MSANAGYAVIIVAMLLTGVGLLAYTTLPRISCAQPHLIHTAQQLGSKAAGLPTAAASAATTAAETVADALPSIPAVTQTDTGSSSSSSNSSQEGMGLFTPLLSQLLPLTNFSQVPSAAVLDGALHKGMGVKQMRKMMEMQQQLFCE